ncbi:MAG: type II toxin-antitoxin system VapC family toxin [Desulfocapsa sp.]|uniref:Type II toxin-antitoxin system VapC family toxin n=1 Tax=Desulfotalea psychrophila TaxID=84980 RepID=A0ABS3AV49_9BACT|nr:type II toxin-antitoxin system VapC family toxin [Desulfocapsa sp.]MBN4068643.1 type II toxin-antitoxin system VapC family toxin [Desulfotalea psychrophila]
MNDHPPEVIQKFRKIGVGNICISSITVSELQYGACKSKQLKKNSKRLEEFLVPFAIISYDEGAANYYGKICSSLEKQGNIIGPLDMLIAAHALSENLTLITNNEKEFKRIKSLKIKNWVTRQLK